MRGAASSRGQYLYTGPSVDLERQEPDFPWERLREERPLVLVYLGTLAFRTDVDVRLFRQVLEVAARRPEWQFVLSVGRKLDVAAFDGALPNVIAVRHAPQIAMLRRAMVMITHGGFNSVKECISMGVPMVVIPFLFDQPGVSARVVHHGLGVRGFASQLTANRLQGLLDEVVHNPCYRTTVRTFRDLFRRAEQDMPAANVVEQFLQRGASVAAHR
jgi:MGT family glycosyltransferase